MRRGPALLWVGVWLLAIGAVAPFLVHTDLYLRYPFSLDETEGFVMGQVARLAQGGQLYGSLESPPYVVDNYPPGFPLVVRGLERAFGAERTLSARLPVPGAEATDPASVGYPAVTLAHDFRIPRAIAMGSLAVIVVSLLALWQRGAVSWEARTLALVLLLAQPPIFFMFPLGRADWGALALGWLALAFAGRTGKSFWVSSPLAVAALLFRQSALMPLLAIGAWLLWQKDPRAKAWVGLSLALVLAGAGLLTAVYGVGFWEHTVLYTKTRFLPARLVATTAFIWQFSALYVVAGIAAWWQVCREKKDLSTIYPPLALATWLLAGKVGSDMNYFLEGLLALGWVWGLAIAEWSEGKRLAQAPAGIGIAAALILLQSAYLQNPRIGSYSPTVWDKANGVQMVRELQGVSAPVLSEEEGLIALAGKEVYFNPFIMSELAREGLWDEGPFVEEIRARKFPVIIRLTPPNPQGMVDRGSGAGWERFTPAMDQAMLESYRLLGALPMRREWLIYVPATPPTPRSAPPPPPPSPPSRGGGSDNS